MKIKVRKGKLIVNSASEVLGQVRVVHIDMRSKRGDVIGWGEDKGVPSVDLMPNEESLHMDESKPEATSISFPEMKGFSVLTADLSRYTVRVVFLKAASAVPSTGTP